MKFIGRLTQLFSSTLNACALSEDFAKENERLTVRLLELGGSNETLRRKVVELGGSNEALRRKVVELEASNEALARNLELLQCNAGELEGSDAQPPSARANVVRLVPKISQEETTPLVTRLLEVISWLKEQVQGLKDEVARLKGLKARPVIKPSKLNMKETPNEPSGPEAPAGKGTDKGGKKKRPGSEKRQKTAALVIHEELVCRAAGVPAGSRFKGYDDFTVQDLLIMPHNTRYRLERWEGPDGTSYRGVLPEEVGGKHFAPGLLSFIHLQYHHAHVTEPLLLEQLWEFGVDISAGTLNDIITQNVEPFHQEKESLLATGLKVSSYIHVDDTTARHQGKNGYCTHIGNELFAYFESTFSKSRINFLQILRGKHTDYVVSDEALEYMEAQKLPQTFLKGLSELEQRIYFDEKQWTAVLEGLEMKLPQHIQTATEGALLGSVLSHDINPELAIISDDAGQFNVLTHGLCWIHAERILARLVGFSAAQREALENIRTQVWAYYQELKEYKVSPDAVRKAELEKRFDELFSTKTCFESLNQALKRLKRNRRELLLVLERPDVAIQNNPSENDIREYVTKRKVSGSTRSEAGRRSRDTFASLKKTCRKLKVSFWCYIQDRLKRQHQIPPLSELMIQKAQASPQHRKGVRHAEEKSAA